MADLHESFIEAAKASKLGTIEGYAEMNAVSHALQAVGARLSDFKIPKSVLARPLQDGEARVHVQGRWFVVNRDGDAEPEHPENFNFAGLPTLITYSDQGTSNTSALNFLCLGGTQLCIHTCYDPFHRGWNDVKLSCRRASHYPWKVLLQMVLLYNLNYSPWGSGAWFFRKQDLMENFMQTRGPSDAWFQSYISKICRERRIEEPTCPEEERELFMSLPYMKNFQRKGPCIKLLRWMSFFEVALEWRGDHWATQMLLLSSPATADGQDATTTEGPEPEMPSLDADPQSKEDYRKTLQDIKKKAGGWKLAPRMVSDHNISVVNMLLQVSKATWKMHAERARTVTTPDQNLQLHVACSTSKYWILELEEMVSASLWDKVELRWMYPTDEEHGLMLEDHCDYFFQLMNTRAASLSSTFTLPPMRWNGVLSMDEQVAEQHRQKMLEEWGLVLRLEAASFLPGYSCILRHFVFWA